MARPMEDVKQVHPWHPKLVCDGTNGISAEAMPRRATARRTAREREADHRWRVEELAGAITFD